jgi:hypothetical protein
MRRMLFTITAFIFSMTLVATRANAQYENAGQYMDHISNANQKLTEKYLVYLSSVSHGKSARKVEKRRQEVVETIMNTRMDIMGMPPFKGDRTLRDTTVAYLKILNSVFNEDYGKIVNMEEIAEQSYDAMEAYMLAQEKAQEKLNEASARQMNQQKVFANKHSVTLVDGGETGLEAKMKLASSVMKHNDEVYLIFFKSYKQEAYLLDAMGKKNINAIEQNLNSLQSFSEQGLEKLKNLQGYNGDNSLIEACRNILNFYLEEVKRGPAFTDFFLKEENFKKIKKKFDASKKTQADADEYNKAVNDMNAAVKTYNDTNNEMNKKRSKELDGWNKASKKYMDTYMPTQQR